jgi:hypothetical protein
MGNKGYFKLKKNINSVVMGNSHSEFAFNDSLIPNLKNISQSGESYFYTYIKAKQIIKQNPQLEIIFIEFTNYAITSVIDEQIWNDKYINFRYPNYSAFMNVNERMLLIKNNLKAVIVATPITLKKQTSRIFNNNYNYINVTGGYYHTTENYLDSILNNPNYLNEVNKKEIKTSAVYNLLYLDKIVALCQKKNIQLYFIRSPLHNNSLHLENEPLFQKIKRDRFPKIKFLDFKDFPLSNIEFRDTNHLNYMGAKKFSLKFNRLLKEELLKVQNRLHSINKP